MNDTINTPNTPEEVTPIAAIPPEAPVQEKRKFGWPKFLSFKVVILILVVLAVLGLAYYYKGLFIAATVDGQPITRFAAVKELEKQNGKEILDALISEKLINIEAEKRNISVSQEEIDKQVKKIEDQVSQSGGTLDEMLAAQGVSRDELLKQIMLQQKAEKILSDKIQVSDEEVDKYITDSGQTLEPGKEAEQREQIKDGLRQQKFSSEISSWLSDARSKASIKEFVSY
jgi:parvulin-like peptidyl-prolyl isomerase